MPPLQLHLLRFRDLLQSVCHRVHAPERQLLQDCLRGKLELSALCGHPEVLLALPARVQPGLPPRPTVPENTLELLL